MYSGLGKLERKKLKDVKGKGHKRLSPDHERISTLHAGRIITIDIPFIMWVVPHISY